jgi:hypothetical protein
LKEKESKNDLRKQATLKKFNPKKINNNTNIPKKEEVQKAQIPKEIPKIEESKKEDLIEKDDKIEKDEKDDKVTNVKKLNKEERDPNDDTFIQESRLGDIKDPVNKSQLVEYDKFYKEQFFKDEAFTYDVINIEDPEEKEINHEMHKLDVKRKLIEKKKEKEVNVLKGLDTEDLELEIEEIQNEYKRLKLEKSQN